MASKARPSHLLNVPRPIEAVFHCPLQEDSEAICVGGISWQAERAGAGFERAKRDHAAGLICDAELVTDQRLYKPFFDFTND